MSTVADSSLNNVTNLRDVIHVPVPVIDVGDSSLKSDGTRRDESPTSITGTGT